MNKSSKKNKDSIKLKSKKALGLISAVLVLFGVIDVSIYQNNKNTHDELISKAPDIKPGKKIYLTFDMDMSDTMSRRLEKQKDFKWYDPELISYLDKNNIQATFFISGLFADTYPEVIRSLALNPNFSFQNHAYDESAFVSNCYWLKTLKTDKDKIEQIMKTQISIQKTAGQTPDYFRYPGICHDQKNDELVQKLGFKISNGNVIPSDPFNHNKEKMVKTVMKEAKDGSVVVMHVGGPNAPKSLEVLKQIVPELASKDFIFAKL
ncbi:MAG: polysaccharide deacetylase family protein [bacterium]